MTAELTFRLSELVQSYEKKVVLSMTFMTAMTARLNWVAGKALSFRRAA